MIGQAVHATGYARVLHNICEHLQNQFEILHFGINYRGAPRNTGWRIRPNELTGDLLGRKALPDLLRQFAPDLTFICHDIGLYKVHEPALQEFKQAHAARVVVYCPVEFPFIEPEVAAGLASVDRLVCYTEFGLREIRAAFHKAALSQPDLRVPACDIIPHGVDTFCFRPLCGADTSAARQANRRVARQILFPERPELLNAFIVLNANRNTPRKRIDLTLEAFARFVRSERRDAWLYLHMGMRDWGCDVLELARAFGIADRLLLTSAAPEKPEIADRHLNVIYNACDVGLNTASGEGWGLVAFEHAAAGAAAQIVPDHSACAQLWREHGLLAAVEERSPGKPIDHPQTTISPERTAELLARLHDDRELLDRKQVQAFRYATHRRFGWPAIAARWSGLFRQLLPPPSDSNTSTTQGEEHAISDLDHSTAPKG
jgi:glycosyltransferase involved in cell wall biosynthesis